MTTPFLPAREVGRRAPETETETRDLGEHLRVLWQYRLTVFGCALLGGGVALGVGVLGPRTYEADAALAISRSKIGENQSLSETLSTANFRPLIESRGIASQVIKDHELDKAPYFASPTTFFGTIVDIEEVRNSTVMLITGRLNDPVLVAAVVNEVATLGSETARRVSQTEAMQARNDIKLQLDEAKTRLDAVTKTLEEARVRSQIELLRKDVDAALVQRGGLLELSIAVETERSRLARAEQELAKRNLVETVNKSIDSQPALLEAARPSGAKPGEVLGLQYKSEEINPVYQDLDRVVATSRTKLAGLERQKAQLEARKLDGSQLGLLSALYAKESELNRLEMERDLAKKVYQDVAISYESARLLVAARSSALQVISAAIPPDKPESRKMPRKVLIGALSGLLLAGLVVVIRHAYRPDGPLPAGGRA